MTHWGAIVQLYDGLVQMAPTIGAALCERDVGLESTARARAGRAVELTVPPQVAAHLRHSFGLTSGS